MSPEAKPSEDVQTVQTTTATSTPKVEVKVESGPLATVPSLSGPDAEWQKVLNQLLEYLSPAAVTGFFSSYRQPLTTLGIVVGGAVTLKVALAVVSALNDIPLLAPAFEGIGIGYTGWFIYRYLLKAENRAELSKDFKVLKDEVVGGLQHK
jgi:hypothetical protein